MEENFKIPQIQTEFISWVPCSLTKPKEGQDVLVTGKMKYDFQKDYEYFVDIAEYSPWKVSTSDISKQDVVQFETWNDWYEGQEEYEILAWASIPERYHEE